MYSCRVPSFIFATESCLRISIRIGWSLFLLASMLGGFTLCGAAQSVTSTLPLTFEPNHGQAPENVRYVLRAGALEGEFQKDSVRLSLLSDMKHEAHVSMRLLGTREDTAIVGDGTLEGQTNYLMGNDAAH